MGSPFQAFKVTLPFAKHFSVTNLQLPFWPIDTPKIPHELNPSLQVDQAPLGRQSLIVQLLTHHHHLNSSR